MAAASLAPLIVIVGETASGKTAAAIKIAQKVGGEIICADSRTIYKHMDIGTAKPTKQEQALVPHHLIDIIQPNETFSVAKFKQLAEKCIQDITSRGKAPVLVGGTGLYIDAVLYNYQFNNQPNSKYRHHLLQMNDEQLTTLLHTKNINITNLNIKNKRHVIRAIERDGLVPKNTKLRQNSLILGLKLNREVLKERITKRVEQIFNDGFLKEVQQLETIYGWDNEAMTGIGYKVARSALEGVATIEEAHQAFVKRDISLAKRQRTWFKRNSNIHWHDDPNKLVNEAIAWLAKRT